VKDFYNENNKTLKNEIEEEKNFIFPSGKTSIFMN
jgi:hypothetical protein